LFFNSIVPAVPRARASLAPLDATAAERTPSGLAVVERGDAAGALLDPTRRRILELLQAPGSATTVAHDLGLSRQRVNYHVRALERAGLVEEVGRRARRGLEERVVRATAAHYLISPDALGALGATPTEVTDRFSATYQVAVAARTIKEVAALSALARKAGKRLTTLTLDTEVRFGTPAAREAFANELVETVTRLAARYHDQTSPGGRAYRFVAHAHPVFQPGAAQAGETPPARPPVRRQRRQSSRSRS
jgi:DNA-binding transcriptional ArsR family regulator